MKEENGTRLCCSFCSFSISVDDDDTATMALTDDDDDGDDNGDGRQKLIWLFFSIIIFHET